LAQAQNNSNLAPSEAPCTLASPLTKLAAMAATRCAQRSMKISPSELHELLMASELVPKESRKVVCQVQKLSADLESMPTAAPSSAEQSPELTCITSDLQAWPSLPAAEDEWSFCNETSDIKDIWEDLPEPALAMDAFDESDDVKCGGQSITRWWLVPGSESTEPSKLKTSSCEEMAKKSTFAAILQNQRGGDRPSMWGTPMPGTRVQPLLRRNGAPAAAKGQVLLDEDPDGSESENIQWHGWKKHNKESWNTKRHLNVLDHKTRRRTQSGQSREWGEEGAPDEA